METDPTTGGRGARSLRQRLRAALPEAMKARDAVAVAALRSALATIDNAEAVDPAPAPSGAAATLPGAGSTDVAGAVVGVGAAEVERRSLSDAQVEELVRAELADRQAAARQYEQAGHRQRAERLRGEAGVLGAYLDGADVSRAGPGTSGRGGGTGTGR
jgi:uncharacterized protein